MWPLSTEFSLTDAVSIAIVTYALITWVPQMICYVKRQTKRIEEDEEPKTAKKQLEPKYYSVELLKTFDGTDGNPIFIAIKGKIYDVSERSDFYGPGAGYHLFAGRDATRALAKMSFEPSELESDDFDDLKFMERETLRDWIMKFEYMKHYPVVGRVLKPANLTLQELQRFNGQDGRAIYVALKGIIYDVTLHGMELFGSKGIYHMCAGKDASRVLACSESKEEELVENPTIKDLTETEKENLEGWVEKFKIHAVVGELL